MNFMIEELEFSESGIRCDNDSCDWIDTSVKNDDLVNWINVSCPKCGENVLTQDDYENAQKLRSIIKYVNSLTIEELNKINESLGINSIDDIKNSPFLKDVDGVDNIEDDKPVSIIVNTHNGIKIEKIRKVE